MTTVPKGALTETPMPSSPTAAPRPWTSRRAVSPAICFLLGLLASCSSPRGLVFLDAALPLIDPRGADSYRSFPFEGGPGRVLNYPESGAEDFLEKCAERYAPSEILLSPLLAEEYDWVRKAFPDAWILGTGLPEDRQTLSAVWNPKPSAREAGRLAGVFLGKQTGPSAQGLKAILVYTQGAREDEAASEAFLEGLRSEIPGIEYSGEALPPMPEARILDSMVDALSVSGMKAVFLNAGASGLKLARELEARKRLARVGAPGNGINFLVLRLSNRSKPETPRADIVISGDPKDLLRRLRDAYRRKQEGVLEIPELLSLPSAPNPR